MGVGAELHFLKARNRKKETQAIRVFIKTEVVFFPSNRNSVLSSGYTFSPGTWFKTISLSKKKEKKGQRLKSIKVS